MYIYVVMWLKKKTELYIVHICVVNNRNTRPGIQREGKLCGNKSGMLLS